MRILWLTSTVPESVAVALSLPVSPFGGWVHALARGWKEHLPDSALGIVATAAASAVHSGQAGEVQYWVLPGAAASSEGPAFLEKIVRQFEPDLVHVHGTDHELGCLAARVTHIPVVVSLQGLLRYCERHVSGGLRFRDFLGVLGAKGLIAALAMKVLERRFRQRIRTEGIVLASASAVFGRTEFDRAYAAAQAPQARYYHVDEAIREPFFEAQWEPRTDAPPVLLANAAGQALKGTHFLLDALTILLRTHPHLELWIPALTPRGHKRCYSYDTFLWAKARRLGVDRAVRALGIIPGPEMAALLAHASAWVSASLAENSPNSLCEAMVVGTPAATAAVGGVSDLVAHGRTALLCPPGAPEALAWNIGRLIAEPALAVRLSRNSRRIARRRHTADRVLGQLRAAYVAAMAD